MTFRALVCLVALCAAACALFPSLDDTGPVDGGDESGGDAANVVDAAHDGVADAAIDVGPWCAAHAPLGSVCFDYGEPDAGAIQKQINCQDDASPCTATITVKADTDSPPNAAVMSIPMLDPYPASAEARYQVAWTQSFQTATLAFDMRIDATIVSGILGALEWGNVYFEYFLGASSLSVSARDFAPEAGSLSHTYVATGSPIDFSVWHRYELTASASKKIVTLSIDGVLVINDTTHSLPLSGGLTFAWGVDYVNGPIDPMQFHFDNVVLLTTTP